jgi:hypothetical protein
MLPYYCVGLSGAANILLLDFIGWAVVRSSDLAAIVEGSREDKEVRVLGCFAVLF